MIKCTFCNNEATHTHSYTKWYYCDECLELDEHMPGEYILLPKV